MRAPWTFTLALLLIAPSQAQAFCRTTTKSGGRADCVLEGEPLFWRNLCRGVRLSPLPAELAEQKSEYLGVLEEALGQWSRPECPDGSGAASLELSYLGETEERLQFNRDGEPNVNAITFLLEWPYPNAANQVALTTITYHDLTGEILDADIEINAALSLSTERPLPRRGFDLRTIYAHELGHLVGLAHSEDLDATMFARYLPGSDAQGTLKDDDRAGLCAIYPPGERRATGDGEIRADACDAAGSPSLFAGEPSEGCSCQGAGPGGSALPLAGAWLLLCARNLFRRRTA